MTAKRCTKCKATLPLRDFPRQAGRPGGRTSRCVRCTSEDRKAREASDRPKRRYRTRTPAELAKAAEVRKLLRRRAALR
jgi:hypothetical protein